MPKPRFKLRLLIAAVAVAALAIGVPVERQRRFERIAESHRSAYVRLVGGVFGGFVAFNRTSPVSDWHLEMARKYELAARHPWLPVAPDSPKPE